MTLLHMDGFEGYGKEDVLSFWDTGSYIDVTSLIDQSGRRGGYCVNTGERNNSSQWQLIWANPNPFDNQIIAVGCAFKFPTTNSNENTLISINGFGDPIAWVTLDSSERLLIKRKPSSTASIRYTSEILTPYTWYYLELKTRLSTTEGFIQCKLNEQILFEEYNVDTYSYVAYGSQISSVHFKNGTYCQMWMDDIYILDTTGSKNNDFLGDIRVDSIHPNGAGNYTDLTPSAGNNYECVDETNMDDTDYVEGANAGEIDSYTYGSVPTDIDDAAIFGIQLRNQAIRTAESDNIKMKGLLRTGSTDYKESTAQSLADIVKSKVVIWEDDPSDSNSWTQAKINACEFGVEVA